MPTFTGRFRRGGGIPTPPKIPYFPEDAVKFFEGTEYTLSCDMVQTHFRLGLSTKFVACSVDCCLLRSEADDFGRVPEPLCIFCVSWERVGELENVSSGPDPLCNFSRIQFQLEIEAVLLAWRLVRS